MDPDAALKELLAAVVARDEEQVSILAEGLQTWLSHGGFPPKTIGPWKLGQDCTPLSLAVSANSPECMCACCVRRKMGGLMFHYNRVWCINHGYLHHSNVRDLRDGQNLTGFLELTPVGNFYVEIREALEAKSKADLQERLSGS